MAAVAGSGGPQEGRQTGAGAWVFDRELPTGARRARLVRYALQALAAKRKPDPRRAAGGLCGGQLLATGQEPRLVPCALPAVARHRRRARSGALALQRALLRRRLRSAAVRARTVQHALP